MLTKEQFLQALDSMSVMQLISLTKELETLWNVKAVPPVVHFIPINTVNEVQTQTEFNVFLTSVPADKKMAVIKAVRDALKMGLKEAKDLVEAAPKMISEGIDADGAEELRNLLTASGAVIEVK